MGHDEGPTPVFRAEYIQFPATSDNTPPSNTVTASGALFCSGGALWYTSYAGTQTQVGPA